MPKRSPAIDQLPGAAQAHLQQLGENLAIARKRRRESMKTWAERIWRFGAHAGQDGAR